MIARRIATGVLYGLLSILTLGCLFGSDPDDSRMYPVSQTPRQ